MTTTWFERDPAALGVLEATLRARYPTLHALVTEGTVTVQGTYPVVHEGHVIDRYSLSIVLPADYPLSLPTVFETAGRIPREEDRHVFPKTGALCIGVPVALWIALGGNFTIDRVLDVPVRNYLIGNCMVEAGDTWPYGECSHGASGVLEFFAETIGTDDPMKVAELIDALIKGKQRGHWQCPCGSGAIIRNCHREAIEQLRSAPAEVLAHSGLYMLDLVKKDRAAAAA